MTVTGGLSHDVTLRVFIGEGDGGKHVSTQINAQNHDRGQTKGKSQSDLAQERQNLGDVTGQGVGDGLLEVGKDQSTLLNATHNRSKVIVHQNHVGRILGDFGTSAHRNTNVSFLQGRGVVHTVTGHSDNVIQLLQLGNNLLLLVRQRTGKHNITTAEDIHPVLLGKMVKFAASNNNSSLRLVEANFIGQCVVEQRR